MTEEEKRFAETFSRTFSIRAAAEAAGFSHRTAFARASRLIERDDVRELVAQRLGASAANHEDGDALSGPTAAQSAQNGAASADITEERILHEYERIAFADTSDGEIKVSDKLRALDQYRSMVERRNGRADEGLSVTVNYDYGSGGDGS